MQKLILTVAPTGNVPTREKTPHVPLSPDEIVKDILQCYGAGAAVAHIHLRDEDGKPTYKKEIAAEIISKLDKTACPIIRQLSTGGRAGRDDQQRAEVVELKPEMVSLCTGSTNFPSMPYINSPQFINYLAETTKAYRIKPELEIFDAAMIDNAKRLLKEGLLSEPLQFNLVLGVKGAMPATAKNLMFLVDNLPAGCNWTVSIIGPEHVTLSAIAIALGGNVRVGIEDNIYYSKGILATNVQLVARMVEIARSIGRQIATPDEARSIYCLD